MWRPIILTLSLISSLAGCAIKQAAECDWATPIRPSVSDELSLGTQRQILTHNSLGAEICGWAP